MYNTSIFLAQLSKEVKWQMENGTDMYAAGRRVIYE